MTHENQSSIRGSATIIVTSFTALTGHYREVHCDVTSAHKSHLTVWARSWSPSISQRCTQSASTDTPMGSYHTKNALQNNCSSKRSITHKKRTAHTVRVVGSNTVGSRWWCTSNCPYRTRSCALGSVGRVSAPAHKDKHSGNANGVLIGQLNQHTSSQQRMQHAQKKKRESAVKTGP